MSPPTDVRPGQTRPLGFFLRPFPSGKRCKRRLIKISHSKHRVNRHNPPVRIERTYASSCQLSIVTSARLSPAIFLSTLPSYCAVPTFPGSLSPTKYQNKQGVSPHQCSPERPSIKASG